MKDKIAKWISVALGVVFALALAMPAYADDSNGFETLPSPRWAYISSISTGFQETSTSGRYFVGADVVLSSSHNSAKITSTLQKYNSGWKDTSYSWSGSGTAVAEATGYVTLSRGDYRIKIDVEVYSSSGEKLESITTYSNDKVIL